MAVKPTKTFTRSSPARKFVPLWAKSLQKLSHNQEKVERNKKTKVGNYIFLPKYSGFQSENLVTKNEDDLNLIKPQNFEYLQSENSYMEH